MDSLKLRFLVPAALVVGSLLVPASSLGATTFGSRLNHEPSNAGDCDKGLITPPCTIASFVHPSDPNGDPYSGGAPVDGVITKFKIRAFGEGGAAAEVTFRLARVNLENPPSDDSALATAAGTGPTVTIPADPGAIETPILEFPAQLPVKQGDHLALDGTNVWATVNNSGDQFSYVYDPPLVDGQGARGSNSTSGELLVAADIEPDADGDGFGDETQDQCSTQAGTQGECDSTNPDVTGVTVGKGKISYRLSEAASLTFKVQRQKKGRKVGGKCRKPKANNLTKPKCKRFVKVKGTLTDNGATGLNELVWNRRIGGRKLRAGRYRLLLTAVDDAGNTTKRTIKFRVKKKKKK